MAKKVWTWQFETVMAGIVPSGARVVLQHQAAVVAV
jgi:hypothetical protein